jgi:hypothetical protein
MKIIVRITEAFQVGFHFNQGEVWFEIRPYLPDWRSSSSENFSASYGLDLARAKRLVDGEWFEWFTLTETEEAARTVFRKLWDDLIKDRTTYSFIKRQIPHLHKWEQIFPNSTVESICRDQFQTDEAMIIAAKELDARHFAAWQTTNVPLEAKNKPYTSWELVWGSPLGAITFDQVNPFLVSLREDLESVGHALEHEAMTPVEKKSKYKLRIATQACINFLENCVCRQSGYDAKLLWLETA